MKAVIGDAVVSTVNWTEVVQKMSGLDDETETVRRNLESLGLKFEPFSTAQAEIAGRLRKHTGNLGLSLGDRACLALGIDAGEAVYTADRVWLQLKIGTRIEAIR